MLEAIHEAISTPQVTPQITPQVTRLLSVLKGEMSARQILHALGLSDRKSFRERYLLPAIEHASGGNDPPGVADGEEPAVSAHGAWAGGDAMIPTAKMQPCSHGALRAFGRPRAGSPRRRPRTPGSCPEAPEGLKNQWVVWIYYAAL